METLAPALHGESRVLTEGIGGAVSRTRAARACRIKAKGQGTSLMSRSWRSILPLAFAFFLFSLFRFSFARISHTFSLRTPCLPPTAREGARETSREAYDRFGDDGRAHTGALAAVPSLSHYEIHCETMQVRSARQREKMEGGILTGRRRVRTR